MNNVSDLHTGIVLGLEDLDVQGRLCSESTGETYSDFADTIIRRIVEVCRDEGNAKSAIDLSQYVTNGQIKMKLISVGEDKGGAFANVEIVRTSEAVMRLGETHTITGHTDT